MVIPGFLKTACNILPNKYKTSPNKETKIQTGQNFKLG